MKKVAFLGVLLAALAACGISDEEVATKEADARDRGFTVTSSGSGGIGGDAYVHVSFGKDGKCSGTVWYNEDKVTLQASLPVLNSTGGDVDFSIDDPRAATLPKELASTSCFNAETR